MEVLRLIYHGGTCLACYIYRRIPVMDSHALYMDTGTCLALKCTPPAPDHCHAVLQIWPSVHPPQS